MSKIFTRDLALTDLSPVDVGLTECWILGLGEYLEELYEYHPESLDQNSGNVLGVGVCHVCNGQSTTNSEASISNTPSNLHDRDQC